MNGISASIYSDHKIGTSQIMCPQNLKVQLYSLNAKKKIHWYVIFKFPCRALVSHIRVSLLTLGRLETVTGQINDLEKVTI